MKNNFFPERPQIEPTIYVYELTGVDSHKGFVKVGYTERDVKERIKEQLHTSAVDFKVLYQESAMRSDGTVFKDTDIHKILKRNGFRQLKEGKDKNEWFNCTVDEIGRASCRERV